MAVPARDEQVAWRRPLAAVCLSGALFLFLGAALSDWAYASSYEIQWNNFAAWLLVGALMLLAVALPGAIADVVARGRRTRAAIVHALLLLAAWVVGFLDALMHARDAWASMPAGLWMSWAAATLAAIATWLAFRAPPARGAA